MYELSLGVAIINTLPEKAVSVMILAIEDYHGR
jgi:hypothetical protein